MTPMTPTEAYDLIYRLARMTAVNGEVGDKRDQALAVMKKLTEKGEKGK